MILVGVQLKQRSRAADLDLSTGLNRANFPVLYLQIRDFEYENRVLVALRWLWNYVTRNRDTRLITGGTDAA